MKNKKCIILEIIPTAVSPDKGFIAQLSALKIKDLKLIERFDYRLDKKLIDNYDIINMTSYDEENFKYVYDKNKIMEEFKKFIEDYDLLIIDNIYTRNYLNNISNNIESIFEYLNLEISDDVIEKMMDKYKLVPSDHIVDLLYEALLFEYENK